jgi:mRNA interferase MazF
MEIQQGDVVAVDFPFTDGIGIKRRPVLVLSSDLINKTGDVVLMQITSKSKNDGLSVALKPDDITSPLPLQSFLRVHKIFTLDSALVVKKLSKLNEDVFNNVLLNLFEILKQVPKDK